MRKLTTEQQAQQIQLQAYQQTQIREAIQNLHDRGKGDFETLLRQVNTHHRKIELNEMQAYIAFSRAQWLIAVVGRGGGKTTARGERWSRTLAEMPRSTGLFIAPSYQAALTRILPSLKKGLEMFGLYENLHYFIGKQPPRNWRNSWGRAYEAPDRYDRYITFFNGMGVHLISHDLPNDGKGLNSDWADGDEAALLDPYKLQENTNPTIRGTNKSAFAHSKLFGSRFYTTSMPLTQNGIWVLDYEEKCCREPSLYNYLEFPCTVNAHNLIDGFLEQAQKDAIYQWIFEAEYLNVRPKFVKDGFYPLLDKDLHCYNNFDYGYYHSIGQEVDCRGDADLVGHKPLIVGVDWGSSINCLVACQHIGREFRALKSMYVLGDLKQIQSDLFEKFDNYYRHHKNKTIFLWYDNMGNNETGITKYTRAQMARKQLKALGWDVRLMTLGGRNPNHGPKHILWNAILKEDNSRMPIFRMNKSNCKELWVSMFNAKALMGSRDEIKKDKSSEKKDSIERQYATDLSDAMDAPIYGMFNKLMSSYGHSLPSTKIITN